MNEDDLKVVQAMESYGGSFVRALAKACYQADQYNLERIKKHFADYWDEYKKKYAPQEANQITL